MTCGLPSGLQQHILGVQGNIWSEWIPSEARMQYMAMPRLAAIAELGWSHADNMNPADYRRRMAEHYNRLNAMNINYRIPEPEGFHTTNAFIDTATVTVSCPDPTATIRYTTDGTTPTADSPEYTSPITITETTPFTFCTFRPNGKRGDVTHTKFNKDTYSAAVKASPSGKGLSAAWHDFTGDRCADIEHAKLNGIYITDGVSIPSEAHGNIGLIINGFITVPDDDIYTFDLTSDDGSTLTIDGDLVVDNDGAHSPVQITAQKALAEGSHVIEVKYFDQNGAMLKLRVIDSKGNELTADHLYSH